ncbi:hypothetical protein [Croceimicrobium sp.]|uniref:hypothetical protein n=1 Tax=Croceimicrobium sp. TaxID=2828340 RepID=UPI003BAAA5B2
MTQSHRKLSKWLVLLAMSWTSSFNAFAQNDSLHPLPSSSCDSCFIFEEEIFCFQWNSDRSLKLVTRSTAASLFTTESNEAYWSKTIFEVYDYNGKQLCRKSSLFRCKGDATITLRLKAIKLLDTGYVVFSAPQVWGKATHKIYNTSGRILSQLEADERTISKYINQTLIKAICYHDFE